MKKIIIILIVLSIFLGNITYAQTDEPSGWATEIVNELKTKEYLRNETFRNYQENITRGEFIYLAVRVYEIIKGEEIVLDESIYFSDTNDIYARKGAAVEITSGIGNNKFGYNQLLTREQLATLMVNVITLLDLQMNEAEVEPFADDDEISSWAKKSIYKARSNNIIRGEGNNRVNPKGNASIEVALVVTNNILNEYKKDESKINENIKEKIEILNKNISYTIDERLFTLFAFMNYTGYDDENNSAGQHDVRLAIKEELNSMDLSLTNDKYFISKGIDYYKYVKVYQEMGGLPDFKYNNEDDLFAKQLHDLPSALKEFYIEANIHDLYLEYLPKHDEVFDLYRHSIQMPLATMLDYLRIDNELIPEFTLQVNLQDAYWRGYGLGSENEYFGKSIITGPSYKPNITNIIHEYLHGVTNPILDNNSSLVDSKSIYLKYSDNKSYTRWDEIVDESFVRALTRLTLKNKYSINDAKREDSKGFVMTSYVYNRFNNEYDEYDGTLEDFIVMLIEDFEI